MKKNYGMVFALSTYGESEDMKPMLLGLCLSGLLELDVVENLFHVGLKVTEVNVVPRFPFKKRQAHCLVL